MNRNEIESIIAGFCKENSLVVTLSCDMPAGYETAYGTYDVTINTLFLNIQLLHDAPEYEVLFFLFHELRHAVQYLHPERFDEQIQESRFYVVLYNGVCYKLKGNVWQEAVLEGSEDHFTRAYMSLPYELDANAFAYEKVKEMCGDTDQLRELYAFWIPAVQMEYTELKRLFGRIEEEVLKSRYYE